MEDEDEQIRRAIELSLQTSVAQEGAEEVLNEDEELARAIQLSLASESSLIADPPVPRSSKSSSSVPVSSRTSDDDVCKRGTLFVLNEIKGMKGADANAGCITIRKLVQPDALVAALVTSFGEDVEWVLSVVPPTIPITLVRHWEAPDKEGEVRITRNIRVIHPPLALPGFGGGGGGDAMRAKMHAKLMLLRYRDDTLRVVVTSANLAQPDYDLVGQTVWYQDFPKKRASGHQPPSTHSRFEETLTQFLIALKADEGFLKDYDFSEAAADLVVSVPGFHRGKHRMDAVGHTQLRAVLRDFQWPPVDQVRNDTIYYQTSSLGALYESFVSEFKESASSGVYPSSTTTATTTTSSTSRSSSSFSSPSPAKRKREAEVGSSASISATASSKRHKPEPDRDGEAEKGKTPSSRTTRGKSGTASGASAASSSAQQQPPRRGPNFAILYPSFDTVRSARPEYRVGAGYLFLQEKHWNAKSFPRALFHDIWPSSHRPSRRGILLHSKVVCRLVTHQSGRRYGWVYAGSHNLSAAAWGRLQKGGTQLFISNFEIGVVLKHPYRDEQVESDDDVVVLPEGPAWERNLPFMVPPPAYTSETEPFIGDKYFSSGSSQRH